MALFDPVSSQDTIKARQKALEDFTDLVPGQKTQQKYEQDKLKMQLANAVGKVPQQQQEGRIESAGGMGLGTLGVLNKAANEGGNLLGKQGQATDALNLQGASLQQDMANAKTTQATKNTVRGIENETQQLARLVADNAFKAGLTSKQLIFSRNNALVDYAFIAMKDDYQKGRISEKEIRDLQNTFALEAEKKRQKAKEYLATLRGSFESDITSGNVERAKSRTLATLAAQKEALEAAAKAQASNQVITGVIGVGGAVFGETAEKILQGLGSIFQGASK